MPHHKVTLANGLRLITNRMPHVHSVCVTFYIGVGSCYETESEAGISHFIEHLLFKGTQKRRTSREISETIESIGGFINGGTSKELTTLWCKVTSDRFDLALDVLVDMLRNSRFDADDINHERQVIIEEINMSLDSPQNRVDMLIDELLWPGQPLGRDIAGTKQTVSAIDRQQMLDFITGRYVSDNIVLSIAGNIEQERVVDEVSQALVNFRPGKAPDTNSDTNGLESPRVRVEFRDTEQAHVCLGFLGLSLFHPDRFTIDLLSVILGEGMSSRLFTSIREQQGLAYDIHSYSSHSICSGAFIVYAGVTPEQVGRATTAIIDQLSLLKEDIDEAELTKAKQLVTGRLLLRLEDSRNVASWLGSQEMLTERILTVNEVTSMVNAVTVDDLRRVAQQLLVGEKLNMAVVGPVREEGPLIELLKL